MGQSLPKDDISYIPPLETDLQVYATYRATLESMHFLGVVEHFRLSVCLWAFTLMSDDVVDRHCITPFESSGEKTHALVQPHESYPIDVFSILAEQNRRDEILYRSARLTFARRVSDMEVNTQLWSVDGTISKPETNHSGEEITVFPAR